MAKKEIKEKKTSKDSKEKLSTPSSINPRIKRTIIGIILLAISLIIILGAFNAAGVAGKFLYYKILYFFFGHGAPLIPMLLILYSVHFFRDKEKVLKHVRSFMKLSGVLLIVEYNVDSGNPWVPYPFTFETFRTLAQRAGFNEPRLLGTHPSRFLKGFYSAATTPALSGAQPLTEL